MQTTQLQCAQLVFVNLIQLSSAETSIEHIDAHHDDRVKVHVAYKREDTRSV